MIFSWAQNSKIDCSKLPCNFEFSQLFILYSARAPSPRPDVTSPSNSEIIFVGQSVISNFVSNFSSTMNMKRKQQTTLSNFFNPKKPAAALDETLVATRLEDEEDLEEGTTVEPEASSVLGK